MNTILDNFTNFDTIFNVVVSSLIINISFYWCCYWIYKNEIAGNWEKYRIRILHRAKD